MIKAEINQKRDVVSIITDGSEQELFMEFVFVVVSMKEKFGIDAIQGLVSQALNAKAEEVQSINIGGNKS